LKRYRDHFQYQLNRLFARGNGVRYLLLGAAFVVLALAGMNAWFFGLFSERSLAAEGIDAAYGGGFWDSLWWSVKHVIDPGAFSEDYGAPSPVLLISFLLSIFGLALFGVFIAFISTSVQHRLELLGRGNTKVVERDHTLILGWSNKVRSILEFLDATAARRQVVAILAPMAIDRMQDGLKSSLPGLKKLEVVFRSGPTSHLEELERVSLATAGSVISLAYDRDGRGEADIEAIKTLMVLNRYRNWARETPPTTVAEITQLRNVEIANIAGGRRVPIVSSSEIISRIIVQAARQPGISAVYEQIFASRGAVLEVRPVPEATGRTVAEVTHWFPRAIPVGVTWKEGSRTAAALNPEPDYDYAEDEQLIMLTAESSLVAAPGPLPACSAAPGDGRKRRPRLGSVLILGWNDNIDEILTELDAQVPQGTVVTVVAAHEPGYCAEYLAAVTPGGFRNLRVDYQRRDTSSRTVLEDLFAALPDAVIVLADESSAAADPDARTLMVLLQLADLEARRGPGTLPQVVVELMNAENRELLAGTPAGDVVVSPQIVSLQLGQVSRNPILGAVYRELLSAGGIECSFQPGSRYVATDTPCTFEDLLIRAQAFRETAIGVAVAREGPGSRGRRIHLNPEKQARFLLGPGDVVIVLAQQVYD
jgi:hypothetical protein